METAALAKSIGNAAREARKALSLTQEDIAERIGVSIEFYARIERGGTMPSVPTLARMIEALESSADAILGRGARASVVRERPSDSWTKQKVESPELRRLLRRLRNADTATLQLLNRLMTALERRK